MFKAISRHRPTQTNTDLSCHRSTPTNTDLFLCWSVLICGFLLTVLFCGPVEASTQKRAPANKLAAKHAVAKKPASPAFDEQALQTQVMLDRAGFSPGEIDGRMGMSTKRALDAFTKNGGKPDPEGTPLVAYKITEADAAGPFTPSLPADMMEKSKLSALGYRDVREALGEKFHASPALLAKLNPRAKFAAGEEIRVPDVADAVQPVAPARGGRQADPNNPATIVVTVRKGTSDLVVTDGAGHALFYAPVTTGSEHDPLPIGDWKVTGVQKNPAFHYNPDLFWDADVKQAKATIPAGPNNPVGVVWVDISRPHYGLHGTPEPSTVGKTTSHGCVRLTNWDAQKLAALVRPGTKVVFAD
jgi:lipoprotein-anchoring transpeptidase ErfK/SrfK